MTQYTAPVAVGTKVAAGKRGTFSLGHKSVQLSDNVTRVHGRSYIGTINAANQLPSTQLEYTFKPSYGAIGLVFDINPTLLGDRVAVIANTFEKYVYTNMKFTYVRQCPTSTPGSVGLVFERDPFANAADASNVNMLSQVMSYEHAQLTPAYVGTSVSYSRDPMEKKTYFTTAYNETITTRETSQGQFLAYISNGVGGSTDFNGAYGFVIFDYTIDLIAPSLMPMTSTPVSNANNAFLSNGSSLSTGPIIKTTISQWMPYIDCPDAKTRDNAGASLYFQSPNGSDAAGTDQGFAFFVPQGSTPSFPVGTVGEIILAGQLDMYYGSSGISAQGLGSPIVVGYGTIGGEGNRGLNRYDYVNVAGKYKVGQKLWFAVVALHSAGTGTDNIYWTWWESYAGALAASTTVSQWQPGTGQGYPINNCLYLYNDKGQTYGTTACKISGWVRTISSPTTLTGGNIYTNR